MATIYRDNANSCRNFDSYFDLFTFQTRLSAKPTPVDDLNSAANILSIVAQKPSNQVGHLLWSASPLDLALPVHLSTSRSDRLLLHGPVNDATVQTSAF